MPEEEEMQQQMQKYQQIQQQLEQVQDFIDQVDENISEMEETIEAVNDLEDQEEGSDILVPIGSGAFIKGQLKDNETIVTNIGGEAFEEKDLDSAESLLEDRRKEFVETKEELQETVEDLQGQMQQLKGQIQQARQGAAEQ